MDNEASLAPIPPAGGIASTSRLGRWLRRPALLIVLAISMIAGVGWTVLTWRTHAGMATLQRLNMSRLSVAAFELSSRLAKFETLPYVLGRHPLLAETVRLPGDARLIDKTNALLADVQVKSGASVVYLLDADGRTVAASNWAEPSSFVGQNYGFRPYFQDAMRNGVGRFYAVGATTGEPGYFIAHRLLGNGAAPGVVVVKVTLDDLELAWRNGGEPLALVDHAGIVLLASDPSWRYRPLVELNEGQRNKLAITRQYGPHPLSMPLLASVPAPALGGGWFGQFVRVADTSDDAPTTEWLIHEETIAPLSWRLLAPVDPTPVRAAAATAATAVCAALAALLLLALYDRQRKLSARERKAARQQVAKLQADLEEGIRQRTRQLSEANTVLESRVDELKRTERVLRQAQDELVHAGKLAVLGQMAAGVAHEINQPLTALHALSDNAVKLLDLRRIDAVRENLWQITRMSERVASIVGGLRAFARKSDDTLAPVDVNAAVVGALAIVQARRPRNGTQVDSQLSPRPLFVLADKVRLEQVILNLIANALDAVEPVLRKEVAVTTSVQDQLVRISITDTGLGLDQQAQTRMFEPFFTTKPSGRGLGLGLAISVTIVRLFGGRLRGENVAEGGACFTVELPLHSRP